MWLLIDDTKDIFADVIARTPEAGKRMLALGGWECLCIDHDLGDDGKETGYDILKWAIERYFLPNNVQLVTNNPVGRQNMTAILLSSGFYTKDGTNFSRKD